MKKYIVTIAALLLSQQANAATNYYSPDKFYMVGFAGINFGDQDQTFITTDTGQTIAHTEFDASGVFGAGLGYQLNNAWRSDITAKYRRISLNYNTNSNNTSLSGDIDNATTMVNLYLHPLSLSNPEGYRPILDPFLVAGVGFAFNDISVTNASGTTTGTINGGKHSDLAWKIGTGLSYHVSQAMHFDVEYDYIDLGSAETSSTGSLSSGTVTGASKINIQTHEILLGLRYHFQK